MLLNRLPQDLGSYSLRMTSLRIRVDALLPVSAVVPQPPFVHVPA